MSDQASDAPRLQVIFLKTMEPSSPSIRFEDIVEVEKFDDGLFVQTQLTIHFDRMTAEHAPLVRDIWELFMYRNSPVGRWEQVLRYFNALPRPFATDWCGRAKRLGEVIVAIQSAPELPGEKLEIAELLMQEIEIRRKLIPMARETVRQREGCSEGGHNSAKLRGEALEAATALCIQLHRQDPSAKKSDLNRAVQELLKRKFDITMSYSGLAPHIAQWLKNDGQ